MEENELNQRTLAKRGKGKLLPYSPFVILDDTNSTE